MVHVGIRERYFHARVEINRHIEIRCHLPENIVFWLVVVSVRQSLSQM